VKAPRRQLRVSRNPLSNSVAPLHTTRKLRYYASFGATGIGSTPSVFQFRLNDCYDFDYTAGGHQPMGFDQMMNFYSTFRVLRTSYHLVASCYSAAAASNPHPTFNALVGVFARANDTLAVTTTTQALEQAGCRYVQTTVLTSELRGTFDHPTQFGITLAQYVADNEFVGTAVASPTRWDVGTVFIVAANAGVYTPTVFVNIMFELDVRFEGPLILATS
jgi:hypothetical protein